MYNMCGYMGGGEREVYRAYWSFLAAGGREIRLGASERASGWLDNESEVSATEARFVFFFIN